MLAIKKGVVICVVCIIAQAAQASAMRSNVNEQSFDDAYADQQPSYHVMAVDAFAGKPLSLLATVSGAAIFVATLPLTILAGNVQQAGHSLVLEPAESILIRPLGAVKRNLDSDMYEDVFF